MSAKASPSCEQAALSLLTRRDYAEQELRQKLREKYYDLTEVDTVIASLKHQNFINDTRFAENRARYRARFSRWGDVKIKQELRQKGVDDAAIEHAFHQLNQQREAGAVDTPLEQATRLVAKKYASCQPSPQLFNKKIAFLVRRGFSLDIAKQAVGKAACAGDGD